MIFVCNECNRDKFDLAATHCVQKPSLRHKVPIITCKTIIIVHIQLLAICASMSDDPRRLSFLNVVLNNSITSPQIHSYCSNILIRYKSKSLYRLVLQYILIYLSLYTMLL